MKYVAIIVIAVLFTGCCGENYVKEMKKLSNNASQQLAEFYKKNKKYPTIEERNEILETIGCTMKSETICSYNDRDITVKSTNDNIGYDISLYLGKNFCYFGLNTDGIADSVSCRKNDCIKIGQ